MNTVKIKAQTINLIRADVVFTEMRGRRRKSVKLALRDTSYGKLAEAFTDGCSWSIEDDGGSHDWSSFSLAGAITDNRDETFTVIMGEKLSELEYAQEQAKASREALEEICGKPDPSQGDVKEARFVIEHLFVKGAETDDERIEYRNMAPIWKAGKYDKGAVYTALEQIWECYQVYDNSTHPEIEPANPAWYTFNRPLHGTTPKTAMPWVQPQHSMDIYKVGEYMIYTDGRMYKCRQQTNFSPEEQADAWETVE